MARRRMSDIRRATVEAAMRERDRQKEADMKASEEAGMQDMKTYREVSSNSTCIHALAIIHGYARTVRDLCLTLS